jgi:cytochrome c oxidase subunit II
MLNKWMGMVPNAAEHGALVDHLLEVCHWFMLVLFVGWFTFFVFSIIRFHRSRNPRANYHGVQSKAATHLEVVVVLVEAVLILGFALPLWGGRVTEESFPNAKDALRVHAVGEQFAWNFHYPGPDGIFGRQSTYLVSGSNVLGIDPEDPASKDDVVMKNELQIVNLRPTVIEVSSKDVIHSFSVHSMRVTQDATPGNRVPLWFKPKAEGIYEIVCAQLCGQAHSGMRSVMTVGDQATFDAWYKENQENQHRPGPAAPAPKAEPAK